MSTVSDSLDKDFPPAYRFSPGDKLVGLVVELSERDGTYGKYPIVTIRTDKGEEFAVHAFHEVLSNELARVAPAVGDEIGIKYLGRHPEKDYHQYKVRRGGGAAGFDWRGYGTGADPAPAGPIDATGLEPAPSVPDPQEEDDIPFLWEGLLTFADVKDHPNRVIGAAR